MFTEMGAPVDGAAWRRECTAFLRDTMAAGTSVSFVADAGGRLVASGSGVVVRRIPGPATPTGTIGYVQSIVTERDWRGRGLARAIVVALLDWYRERGIAKVDLHATGEGEPLYRDLGFVPVTRYPEMRWEDRGGAAVRPSGTARPARP
jgi:GNAT superfamily N-acetyltransferase